VLFPLCNDGVADLLDEVADLLDIQNANPFRVRAYHEAAGQLRRMKRPAYEIVDEEGIAGLRQIPGVGTSLAKSIEQLIHTGQLALLARLRGDARPERCFESVPGIGRELAKLIHEQLDIETLADLQAAAWDGRLSRVPGMGLKRVRAVRDSLAGRYRGFGNFRWRETEALTQPAPSREPVDVPSVAELLDVDREYRDKAARDQLTRIAPQRLNPTGEAWLPILHTERGTRHFTALFSNTARAHELGTTHDWVVIYRDDHDGDGQWTVISSRFGALVGKRIVRGREDECKAYYATHGTERSGGRRQVQGNLFSRVNRN
jgi:hypothetical protein